MGFFEFDGHISSILMIEKLLYYFTTLIFADTEWFL